jgi:2-polyprenyl-3-methyl-5-hydroxy-6-metoxy-1,4-benzoquinol methylase
LDHEFAVLDEIPRFVSGSTYADAFGAQWRKYRRTQLDSYSGTTITRDRVQRCFGDELWNSLRNTQILECGCGAGRFTEVLLDRQASVTSVDLSDAVEANARNFPVSTRHRIAQASILSLPFEPRQFGVVFCLGVIQHTPCPEETISCLYEQVKPGGWLVIDHYTWNLSYFTKTAPLFRMLLKRMRPSASLRITEMLVDTFLPIHKTVGTACFGQKLLSRLSPVAAYYREHPQLRDDLQREWALLDTHDSLTDWYKWFRSLKQIRSVLECLGLEQIYCTYAGNGVEARGVRPVHNG